MRGHTLWLQAGTFCPFFTTRGNYSTSLTGVKQGPRLKHRRCGIHQAVSGRPRASQLEDLVLRLPEGPCELSDGKRHRLQRRLLVQRRRGHATLGAWEAAPFWDTARRFDGGKPAGQWWEETQIVRRRATKTCYMLKVTYYNSRFECD